jgi:hypothetical protein
MEPREGEREAMKKKLASATALLDSSIPAALPRRESTRKDERKVIGKIPFTCNQFEKIQQRVKRTRASFVDDDFPHFLNIVSPPAPLSHP